MIIDFDYERERESLNELVGLGDQLMNGGSWRLANDCKLRVFVMF